MLDDAVIRPNAWKVLWVQDKKKYFKVFEGDKPKESGAVDFGKKLQARGIKDVNIISKRRPFDKPLHVVIPHGLLWCPYCLKIREFHETAIRNKDGRTPRLFRCPTCTVSIHDAAIRRNNPDMVAILDARARLKKPKLPTEKTIRKNRSRR